MLHLRSATLQYLQSLRRAGVTHLPRPQRSAPLEATAAPTPKQTAPPRPHGPQTRAAVPQPRSNEVSPANAVSERDARPSAAVVPGEAPRPRVAEVGRSTSELRRLVQTEGNPLTREEREKRLRAVACEVAKCRRCEELAESRTQTVFGVGSPEARIMFIGEAPGADEDRQGEPFVGKAGQLLNKIIEACQIRREELYICNTLRCRPPGNRTPTSAEAANCREFLDAQIALVDPEYIVCWGNVAAQNLLNTKQSMARMRQMFHQHGRAKVLCTYHPSYLLRNPPAKKEVWEDMQFLFRDMGVDLAARPSA